MKASAQGHLEVVKTLIDKDGSIINTKDNDKGRKKKAILR